MIGLDEFNPYKICMITHGKMVQDKTSIYISHRMSSCRFCDNILVFDNGQIVEQGNHEMLLKKNGFYARLYNSQFAA